MPLPALGAAGILSTVLAYSIGRLAFKIITGLGLGLVVYTGANLLFDQINDYLLLTLSGAPATVVQILDICNVPQAINMLFAAYVARVSVSATIKRLTVGNT